MRMEEYEISVSGNDIPSIISIYKVPVYDDISSNQIETVRSSDSVVSDSLTNDTFVSISLTCTLILCALLIITRGR